MELVTAADLENAKPSIEDEDIVVIVTGWHRRYSDSIDYFGNSPGLSNEAAEWLIDKRIKLVAIDTPQVDHPLATSLGLQRNGPQMRRLPKAYQSATGRDPKADFPEWDPAHRTLLSAGVPTIETLAARSMRFSGRRTFQAYPWNWPEGDACIVRFTAILDPWGAYRSNSGMPLNGRQRARTKFNGEQEQYPRP